MSAENQAVMIPALSSLVAAEVVVMITSIAISDDKVSIMIIRNCEKREFCPKTYNKAPGC